LADDLPLL